MSRLFSTLSIKKLGLMFSYIYGFIKKKKNRSLTPGILELKMNVVQLCYSQVVTQTCPWQHPYPSRTLFSA